MKNSVRRKNLLEKKVLNFRFLGLIIATAITLLAFEWRTPAEYKNHSDFTMVEEDYYMENIPVSVVPDKPQPEEKVETPKDKIGTEIKAVDELDDPEVTLEKEKTDPVDEFANFNVDDMLANEAPEDLNVILKSWEVSELPYIKTCEDLETKEEREICSAKELNRFVTKNLKYPREAIRERASQVIHVEFVVDKKGRVSDAEVLNPDAHPALAKEAIRIVENLPEFHPAVSGHHPVSVRYRWPIKFNLR